MTFSPRCSEQMAGDAPTRVTFELSSTGNLTTVVLTHDEFVEGIATAVDIATGWPHL
jgi:hypothetical protein